MAGSVQPELNRSIMNANQLDLGFGLPQTRAGGVERFQDAGFQIIGMEGIEEKQVADDRILAEFMDDRLARLAPESKTSSIIRSSPAP